MVPLLSVMLSACLRQKNLLLLLCLRIVSGDLHVEWYTTVNAKYNLVVSVKDGGHIIVIYCVMLALNRFSYSHHMRCLY